MPKPIRSIYDLIDTEKREASLCMQSEKIDA